MLSRLNLIEQQPLEHRAAAFALLHDELRATLEGKDPSHRQCLTRGWTRPWPKRGLGALAHPSRPG